MGRSTFVKALIILVILLGILTGPSLAAVVTTTFTSNNSFAGKMFDVTNLTGGPLEILGLFDMNVRDNLPGAANQTIAVC